MRAADLIKMAMHGNDPRCIEALMNAAAKLQEADITETLDELLDDLALKMPVCRALSQDVTVVDLPTVVGSLIG